MSGKEKSNYARHAQTWGWGEPDRSEEIEFYSELARKYGGKVLSLVCATGDIARGMAEKGFQVTGVDIEPEMIAAAKKNSPDIDNPRFLTGDVTSLHLPDTGFDFAFIGTGDFHHLVSEGEMLKALTGVYQCLKNEGCLTLELFYPETESWHSPKRRFDLPNPSGTGMKAWKFGETRYDADTKLQHIKQEVFIEERGTTTSFSHEFSLQLISRETLNSLLGKAGFHIVNEYSGFDFSFWQPGSDKWIVEAIRK